ncbi:MAG: nucleotidyl transferase AbiEii/AbiGii toxin family protein, partial [Bacteroidales bacterium]|nr:nucleotidyl transferase AbiEii/AbiGii toxin family protein [Bacteroidales bacterium]
DKLASTNIEQVKKDVLPFIKHPEELNIWSNDYFQQLADMIIFE